ncbi:DUF6678 family protein [Clostridium uliginosum]|uniref:Uncharacterized protein n=1 Tax=Clostridium uliginosum TaxID=119641 RepID=A0A1I1P701_9CLOT|nr:DUF6678 family protein [Clostridium uliginosum]SFD01760.1 hypothetical protein SAMN05421842_11710 [Clostridium uliginosum]
MEKSKIKFDLEKYKKKVANVVEQKKMFSVMNQTKWKELRNAMINDLPFPPPYICKDILFDDLKLPAFDKDVTYIGNWDYEMLYPFVGIQWIKIRPRYLKHRGRLIDGELIDETEEFISVLKRYSIPYEEENRVFTIYGYKEI